MGEREPQIFMQRVKKKLLRIQIGKFENSGVRTVPFLAGNRVSFSTNEYVTCSVLSMARRLNPNTSGDDAGLYKGDTSAGRTPADSSVET